MADQRWATFDCYGTLIDWNGGIRADLERLFGVEGAPRLLERYHQLEPQVQAEEYRSYAEVLTLTLMRLAEEESLAIPEGEADALVRSLRACSTTSSRRTSLASARSGSIALVNGPAQLRHASCRTSQASPRRSMSSSLPDWLRVGCVRKKLK